MDPSSSGPQGPDRVGIAARPSATMACWALALSVLPTVVGNAGALALAFVVLDDTRRGLARGRRLAIAAIVVSSIWLLLVTIAFALGIASGGDDDRADRPRLSGTVLTVSVRPGECLTDGVTGVMPRVPCDGGCSAS